MIPCGESPHEKRHGQKSQRLFLVWTIREQLKPLEEVFGGVTNIERMITKKVIMTWTTSQRMESSQRTSLDNRRFKKSTNVEEWKKR